MSEHNERRKVVSASEARLWRESLGLSVASAGAALNLSNPSVTFRSYERPGGKTPAPPTVALMDMIALVVAAMTKIKRGDLKGAEAYLIAALPEPVLERMDRAQRAPIPR